MATIFKHMKTYNLFLISNPSIGNCQGMDHYFFVGGGGGDENISKTKLL